MEAAYPQFLVLYATWVSHLLLFVILKGHEMLSANRNRSALSAANFALLELLASTILKS